MAQSYQDRVEAAQERGYDSLYDQTVSRREAREFIEDHGGDPSRENVWAVAEFQYAFDEGQFDRDSLRDFFDEYIGGSDDDFYDWLAELYGEDA